jgi:head-tail adaptor
MANAGRLSESLVTRSADLVERLGKEAIQGGELSDVVTATMRLRKDSSTADITHADRVVVRGHTWAIKSVVQVDRKGSLLEFLLERGVAQ